jgi:hypothetical protein
MQSRETGALQFLARLDVTWPPHRCRIKDSRSSLVDGVRRMIAIAMIAGRLAVWGEVGEGDCMRGRSVMC